MKLEGYDIDRLLSGPGDFRPHIHEDDHESLKEGIIRGVYKNQQLTRRECKPVREAIFNAYYRLQQVVFHDENFTDEISDQELVVYKKVFWANKFQGDVYKAVADTIDWYTRTKDEDSKLKYKENGEIDNSALFAKLVLYISFRCLSVRGAFHFRHLIHAKCKNKYGNNDEILKREIERVIKIWKGPIFTSVNEQYEYLKEKRKDIQEFIPQSKKLEITDKAFFLDFFNKICERAADSVVDKESFIQKYQIYCKNQKRSPMTEQQITRQMTQLGIKTIKIMRFGERKKYYETVKFKSSP